MRAALESAGISPDAVAALQMHGTGTPLVRVLPRLDDDATCPMHCTLQPWAASMHALCVSAGAARVRYLSNCDEHPDECRHIANFSQDHGNAIAVWCIET